MSTKPRTEPETLELTHPGLAALPAHFPLVLVVEYDLNLCSPNRNAYGGSPDAAKAMLTAQRALEGRKKAMRARVRQAYDAAGAPVWNVPVLVDVEVRRGDRIDETNLRAAVKAGEDALFKNAVERYVRVSDGKRQKLVTPQRSLTPDDRPSWVEWGEITQEIDRRWRGKERFTLTIWPRAVIEQREAAAEHILRLVGEMLRRPVEMGELWEAAGEGVRCGLYSREGNR